MSSNLTNGAPAKLEYAVIDHIGWELWKATEVWKRDLVKRMIGRGFQNYAEARYGLLRYFTPNGISQTKITTEAGLTKQAVQQHIDDLVKDGLVVREPDPEDARKKTISLTDDGLRLFAELNKVKQEIEQHFEARIGEKRMAVFREVLVEMSRVEEE